MKKLYILFLLSSVTLIKAQSLLVTNNDNGGSVMTNSMSLYPSAPAGATSHINLEFKNISSSSKSYLVTRYKDLRHWVAPGDSSYYYFCTGATCYGPNTATSPSTIVLSAGSSIALVPYIDEASVQGRSDIRYKIYNVNDANDYFTFTVSYNNILSVKSLDNTTATLSNVFPNPSSNKAKINVTSTVEFDNATVTITNSLGSIVSVKSIDIPNGKSTIILDTENLNSGIYFATININNTQSIKKFIINK